MKKKAYLIFLILGLIVLAVGVFFFGRICAVKDSIYAKYLCYPASVVFRIRFKSCI